MAGLQADLHASEQKLKVALTGGSSDAIAQAIEGATDLGAYKLVIAELKGLEAADLRNVWDTIRQKVQGPVCLRARYGDLQGSTGASCRGDRRGCCGRL